MEREKAPARLEFAETITSGEFSPDWQPFSPDECPGLFFTSIRILEPKLEMWALKADLSEPSLKITVNGGGEGTVSGTKVSSFVRNNGLLAGINAVPFEPVSAKEDEERTCVGIVVSNGVATAGPVPRYDALVFYKNGRSAIVSQAEIGDLDRVEHALGGFNIILADGKLPERLLSEPRQDLPRQALPRHPRSAAGLSIDGQTLYLLVIDGRRKGSAGATEAETALILRKLGAFWGLNFDGGGSSALALRFPDGRVRTVNTPIHSGIPGRERAVAACLGLGTVEKK